MREEEHCFVCFESGNLKHRCGCPLTAHDKCLERLLNTRNGEARCSVCLLEYRGVTQVRRRDVSCIPHWYALLIMDTLVLSQVAYVEIILFFKLEVRIFFAFMVIIMCITFILAVWMHYQAFISTGSCICLRMTRSSTFRVLPSSQSRQE